MAETKAVATAIAANPEIDIEVAVDAWLAGFANTVMAHNTECYSFLIKRRDDLVDSLKGQ